MVSNPSAALAEACFRADPLFALEKEEKGFRAQAGGLSTPTALALITAHLSLAERDFRHTIQALRLAVHARGVEPVWRGRVESVIRVRRHPTALSELNRVGYGGRARNLPDPAPENPRPPALTGEEFRTLLRGEGSPGDRFDDLRGTVLREMVSEDPADPYQSLVWVVHTSNYGLGILKQVRDEEKGPLAIADREDRILTRLSGLPGVPRVLAAVDLERGRVMLRTPARGIPLADTLWRGVSRASSLSVLTRLARTLAGIHSRGVMVGDLHSGNCTVEGDIFDLSAARVVPSGGEVDYYPTTFEVTAPEVWLTRRAGLPADVYALGVVAHQLLTGSLPYEISVRPCGGEDYERVVASAQATSPYVALPGSAAADERWGTFLARMLRQDPAQRPSAEEVATAFQGWSSEMEARAPAAPLRQKPSLGPRARILVPMRAGVPHRGHVELLTGLLDLGFDLTVSLQKSFTWTAEDPMPKWLVARVLKRCLQERGYSLRRVRWAYMPYESRDTMRALFLLMPGWEECVAVASGNPGMEELLGPVWEHRVQVDSEEVCGPGALLRYNGTAFRSALRAGDWECAERMCPPELADELPWLGSFFPREREEIEQTPVGHVRLEFAYRGETRSVRLLPYEGPEEALARKLSRITGETWSLVGEGARVGQVEGPSERYLMVYRGQVRSAGSQLQILYDLEAVSSPENRS